MYICTFVGYDVNKTSVDLEVESKKDNAKAFCDDTHFSDENENDDEVSLEVHELTRNESYEVSMFVHACAHAHT